MFMAGVYTGLIVPSARPSRGMNTLIAQSTLVARVESESRPGKFYEIKVGADGVTYCSCPAWRMQHNSPSNRSCKHIVAFKAKTIRNFDPSKEPVAVRPVRRSRAAAARAFEANTVRRADGSCSTRVDATFARPTSWERL